MAAIAMLITGLAAGTASAQSSITVVNCNHYSGPGTPVRAVYVRELGDGAATGAAQLCRTGSYYWAYVVFYAPLPSTTWGQAYLIKYHNGVRVADYDCDSLPQGPPSGGNGWVEQGKGQTQCWTPKIYAPSASDTFQACGYAYFGPHPSRAYADSWGCTPRVR